MRKKSWILGGVISFLTLLALSFQNFSSLPTLDPIAQFMPVPPFRGLFRVGNTAYQADGKAYCSFPNMDIFKAMTGKPTLQGLPYRRDVLGSQESIGYCKFHGVVKSPPGFYYTDGETYCAYHNWNQYTAFTGKGPRTFVPEGKAYLRTLKYSGLCKMDGLFRFQAGVWHSNGKEYCHLNSWKDYVEWTGTWNVNTLPRIFQALPSLKNLRRACQFTKELPLPKVSVAENNFHLKYKVTGPIHLPMELPVTVLSSGTQTNHIFTTGYSRECPNIKGNPAKDLVTIDSNSCELVSISDFLKSGARRGLPIPADSRSDWKRSYDGVMSAHAVGKSKRVYLVRYGENKNQAMPGGMCDKNTVKDVSCQECAAGLDEDGVYRGCPLAHSAFINLSTRKDINPSSELEDLGPITWPANGYVAADGRTTTSGQGLLHAKSIVHDGHLYIFYVDRSGGNWEEGRGPGIKVARAPIRPDDTIDPYSFRTYYDGAFRDSALPAGFKKENIRHFYQTKGGRSSHLFGKKDYAQTYVSFSVAKIIGTKYFLGVSLESAIRGGGAKVVFRTSEDLVNWSAPVEAKEFALKENHSNDWWVYTPMLYTSFLNKEGTRSDLINLEDFYLVSTSYTSQDHVNSYRMRMRLVFPGLK